MKPAIACPDGRKNVPDRTVKSSQSTRPEGILERLAEAKRVDEIM